MTGLDFLACAERLASSAHEADLRSAISRAYYGAFHVALALLQDQGIRLPKTKQVHVKIAYCFQDCGDSSAQDAGELLEFLRSQRRRADYELRDASFSRSKTIRGEVAQARLIVDDCDRCRMSAEFRSKVRAQAKLLGLPVTDR